MNLFTLRRHNFGNASPMREPIEVFSVRDLRNRAIDLVRNAEEGKLAIITKHGRPVTLAIPFDERLLSIGVHRALTMHLFQAGQVV
ncbi:MAG TPA: type II toxin-antitoxin system prevent-host-death family antitoxin [Terriglobia bacterium]|nr:type II toxin-antitoxin system prevent-host-death family antitoxin [Terriglobia bacterium]